ncbi:MAG: cytochrome c biogenesis protein ResB [Nitrospirota bacterium]
MEKKQKSLTDRTWDFLASVKLAIIIFALISLTSIVGTILEQNASAQANIKILSGIVGYGLAPKVYRVLETMGFMDMYRSWWFIGLLMLFSVNLLICSLDRLPRTWKLVVEPFRPLASDRFRAFGLKREFTLPGKTEANRDKLAAGLRSLGFRRWQTSTEGGLQYYAQKGRLSRLGVYITHLSIIVILLGAVVGWVFGYKGFVNIPEGTSTSLIWKRTLSLSQAQVQERRLILRSLDAASGDVRMAAARLNVTEKRLRDRMEAVGLKDLGFSVTCEDFDVSFYGQTDIPKEYASLLTVHEGPQEVKSKWIEVNDPLKYKGWTFYQSSYSILEDPSRYIYIFRVISRTGEAETVRIKKGGSFTIPGTDVKATVVDYSPALSMDASGRYYTYADAMNNPAAKLAIDGGGQSYTKWVLRRYPETGVLPTRDVVQLMDIWGSQRTGLEVRIDPGVRIVYLGCILISIGLYFAFFMSHRKVWVHAATEKGQTKVLVAGTTSKYREGYEKRMDAMIARLKGGK